MRFLWTLRGFPALARVLLITIFTMIGIGTAATPAAGEQSGHHDPTSSSTGVCAASSDGMVTMGGMMSSTPASVGMMGTPTVEPPKTDDFDLMFIDMMIPHHESAVAMAQVALTHGEHKEIRDLAQNVIDSQAAESAQMRAWRDAWYPNAPVMPIEQMTQIMDDLMQGMDLFGSTGTPNASMGGRHQGSGMDMMDPTSAAQSLCTKTGPFDREFIQMMLPHHQGAITMAQVALINATHPEIKELARAIIDSQQREIGQMEAWLTDWYGDSPEASPSGSEMGGDVVVTLSEFEVDASRTEFRAGHTYRFVVTNGGVIDHEFMIMPHMNGAGQMDMETLDAMALVMIPASDLTPGTTRTVEVTFPNVAAKDSYEIVCAVPGHYNAGMVLPVVITA